MLNWVLIAVIILALSFDFINGFHDTANSIATTVSTRVLTPRLAILMAAVLNFVGAFLSQNVAKTIAGGIVHESAKLEQYAIVAALLSAIIWNLITWYLGIPSSSSHALIGGLIGSTLVFTKDINSVLWGGVWEKVVLPLVSSPLLGFFIGYLVMKFLFFVLRSLTPHTITKIFGKLQIVSAALMALSHGGNDAQKSMGIITLALIACGYLKSGSNIPPWVIMACAVAMALGTSIGGWKIIKTMGVNMIKLQPVGGFAAETSAAAVIHTMTLLGAPVSTTHVISSSIMGVGSAKRFSAVRWSVARNIVWAWVFTLPITAFIGALVTLIFKLFM